MQLIKEYWIKYRGLFIVLLGSIFTIGVYAVQNNESRGNKENKGGKINIGAYYFDGWTGTYSCHITPLLQDSFPDREPKWGWITSTPEVMKEQINSAADAGLSFFSFCWYYPNKNKYNYANEPLNNALDLYRKAPNKNRLKYCIMVANHQGFFIGPKDMDTLTNAWIGMFKDHTYLKVDGKPLLIFFSLSSLVDTFGSEEAVYNAFEKLRQSCITQGLKGVSIAVCSGPDKKSTAMAKNCGIDILTGYNYHEAGFIEGEEVTPIENMLTKNVQIWNKFPKNSSLPYIPVATLNWDARPWKVANKSRYTGYSPDYVYKSVKSLKNWINENPNNTCKERLALLYAWNEYGEGAWLTPSKNGVNMLEGLEKAAREK